MEVSEKDKIQLDVHPRALHEIRLRSQSIILGICEFKSPLDILSTISPETSYYESTNVQGWVRSEIFNGEFKRTRLFELRWYSLWISGVRTSLLVSGHGLGPACAVVLGMLITDDTAVGLPPVIGYGPLPLATAIISTT